jgi:hypothetical protein
MLRIPGLSTSRIGKNGVFIGCLVSSLHRLVPIVLNWCQHNLCTRAACRTTAWELAVMQEEVYVYSQRLRHNTDSTRRSFRARQDKLLDSFGSYCETIVTNAIYAFQMAMDRWVKRTF